MYHSIPSAAAFCPLLTHARPQLEFVEEKVSKKPFDPALGIAMAVHNEGILQLPGIMMYPGMGSADGREGDHIIIAPPYTITTEDIEKIVAAARKAVDSAFERILCCMCDTLLSEEGLMTTDCCFKDVGLICWQEIMQENNTCCLCQMRQPAYSAACSDGSDYKFHFTTPTA